MFSWVNRYSMLLIALVACQGLYWHSTRHVRPDLSVVPTPPGELALEALTFGDKEFYFRLKALQLQNFGDSFGRFTSLRYYDYSKLYQWFLLMDKLNARSNFMPSLATYYFSQTQNNSDVRYVLNYLYLHSSNDISHKWWWLLQGIYLATHRINDLDFAIKIASPMMDPSVPAFAQQMVAVVYEKRGEMDAALDIMTAIAENTEKLTADDLRYMRYFVEERLGKLEELQHMPAMNGPISEEK